MPGKSVAEEFVDHRLLSRMYHYPRSQNLPLQLNMPAYDKEDPPCQTTLCTRVAVEQYDAEHVESEKIREPVGVDSQIFILNQNHPMTYWHLYFKETVKEKPRKFFAELSCNGVGGPTNLIQCREVDKDMGASVVNCDHCFGGIWHPPNIMFIGRKPDE